jgi:hypothetical protein
MEPNQVRGQADSHNAAELQSLVLGLLDDRLKSFKIDVSQAGIVLDGFCDSFHVKQMAQEIIRQHTSLPIVTNRLEVNYPNSDKSPPSSSGDGSHNSGPNPDE